MMWGLTFALSQGQWKRQKHPYSKLWLIIELQSILGILIGAREIIRYAKTQQFIWRQQGNSLCVLAINDIL